MPYSVNDVPGLFCKLCYQFVPTIVPLPRREGLGVGEPSRGKDPVHPHLTSPVEGEGSIGIISPQKMIARNWTPAFAGVTTLTYIVAGGTTDLGDAFH